MTDSMTNDLSTLFTDPLAGRGAGSFGGLV